MLYLFYLLLSCAIPYVFCDGKFFGISQPVNLTGEVFPATSMVECAVVCAGKDDCERAEYTNGSCVTSPLSVNPLHVAPNEPGLNVSVESKEENGVLIYNLDAAVRPLHCADILSMKPDAPSGVYIIWPDGVTRSRVWCDMDTDGGGWTNVYSYKTLNAVLDTNGNSVRPRPTWPLQWTDPVSSSTTPPSDLHQYGALDFPLWINIGEEFMIKSNVNNWIACTPGTGSFSKWIEGSINCRMINSITTICPDLPTDAFSFRTTICCGPEIVVGSQSYYYFREVVGGDGFPTHDPCGTDWGNNLQGIQPEGQIWLR